MKKLTFTYFIDQNNITMTQKPNLAYIFKLYNMKKIYPESTFTNAISESDYINLLNGNHEVTADIDISPLINSTYNIIEIIKVAGRIFYEIQLKDLNQNAISFIHFQSQFEIDTEFPIRSSRLWIIGVVIMNIGFLVLIVMLIYKYCTKGNRQVYDEPNSMRKEEKGEIEIEENVHERIPNSQANLEG